MLMVPQIIFELHWGVYRKLHQILKVLIKPWPYHNCDKILKIKLIFAHWKELPGCCQRFAHLVQTLWTLVLTLLRGQERNTFSKKPGATHHFMDTRKRRQSNVFSVAKNHMKFTMQQGVVWVPLNFL